MAPSSVEGANKQKYELPSIKGDRMNIFLLSFMYLLQGTMFGLTQAIPLILQNRKSSYTDQAEFSIVTYPACFKLLWAPIIDCIYWKKMGRRKTWIIPMQYLTGVLLLILAVNAENWLGSDDGKQEPHIHLLTLTVFACACLTATHDIALDAWSITMLQKRNIGHSGSCQSIGNAVGQFLAFVLFIILDSKDFSNMFRSVPQNHGFVSFDKFLSFWAITFLASTTLIFIFKKEVDIEESDEEDAIERKITLKESYLHLWRILQIRPLIMICVVLLTCRIGFGPVNGVAPLKLLDAGVPRDKFALMTIPSLPFQLILPFALSRYLTGPRSMRAFVVVYILKLIFGLTFAVFIFFTPFAKDQNQSLPTWYYCMLLLIYNIQTLGKFAMAIAAQAFFSRVSDPRFGGTYLTLLNTTTNMGSQWPQTVCLWFVDILTISSCTEDPITKLKTCHTVFDGYYTESIVCAIIAALWLFWGKRQIQQLEDQDPTSWIVRRKQDKPDVIKEDLHYNHYNLD